VGFARNLWPAAQGALGWMERGDGYLRYQRRSPVRLEHQGWKDSHEAVMHVTGEPPTPPIALVQVQGHHFAALLTAAAVGLGEPFMTLATALFDAVHHFESAHLPELFCGFPRKEDHGPTRYPVAALPRHGRPGSCSTWWGGMLGFQAEAAANRLTLDNPRLPPWLDWIEIRGLRVGQVASRPPDRAGTGERDGEAAGS
jgi:glycogen debranching enzyme